MVELHERLGVVHALIGEYDTALERYQAALDLLQQQPDATIDGLVRLHHHIARVYGERGAFETALEWVERALALASETRSLELARCLLLGAGLHQRQGRYGQALEWGERALPVAEQLDSLRDQAMAFKLIGGTYRNMGENTRALDILEPLLAALRAGSGSGAAKPMPIMIWRMSATSWAGSPRRANTTRPAPRSKRRSAMSYGQAMIANNLGDVLKLQDDIDEAITQYQRSLAIFERLGSRYATGVLHMNLGATYIQRGDLKSAEERLRQSADLFNQVGAEDFLPELERYLAELHLLRDELPKARLACELSLATALRLEARAEEGMTRRILARIMAQDGDTGGAWEELDHSLAILREAAGPHEIARTLWRSPRWRPRWAAAPKARPRSPRRCRRCAMSARGTISIRRSRSPSAFTMPCSVPRENRPFAIVTNAGFCADMSEAAGSSRQ